MVNNCVVQGCVVGTAKQNVTLREFPKASRRAGKTPVVAARFV